MYAKKTILTIVAVLIIAATLNANIVIVPIEEPIPGGGGGSGPGPLGINTSAHQWINLGGLEMNCSYDNRHPDTTFRASTNLDQGAFNMHWVYNRMSQQLYRDRYNPLKIYGSVETSYKGYDEASKLPGGFNQRPDYKQNLYINLPGLQMEMTTQIENKTEYKYDEIGDYWYPVETDGLYARHTAWIEDAEIIAQSLNSGIYMENELHASFSFNAMLIGDPILVEAITSELPVVPFEIYEALAIPEPATIILVALGTFLARRKRK
jgi:hypothetical protein